MQAVLLSHVVGAWNARTERMQGRVSACCSSLGGFVSQAFIGQHEPVDHVKEETLMPAVQSKYDMQYCEDIEG